VARRTTAEERQKRNRGFTRSTRIELIGEMPTLPNAPPTPAKEAGVGHPPQDFLRK